MEPEIIKIPLPSLFSFDECIWFLDRNLDDCMHVVAGNRVRKLLYEQEPLLLEISADDTYLKIEILSGKCSDPGFVTRHIEEWFDLNRNIAPFYKLLKKDKALTPLCARYKGFRIVGIPDLFEALCWCIMGQQINLDFAYRIKRRFVERYGTSITYEGKSYYLFPRPETIEVLTVEELRLLQLTTRKAEYITGIAREFSSGRLSREALTALPTEPDMLEQLLSIRGIGEWTANYTLMKSLRAMNCIPYGDVGVNNALFQIKGIHQKNNRLLVDEVFNNFEGWKTYLVFYLWRSLRNKEE